MKTKSVMPTVAIGTFIVFLLLFGLIRQNWRTALRVAIGTFFVSLLLSSVFAYVGTEALTETRKSALTNALSEGQIKGLGAFHWYDSPWGGYWCERDYVSELSTADALLVLATLNASNRVNVDDAIKYICCKQYQSGTGAGGFGAKFDCDGTFLGCDLYSTYRVVNVLNSCNSLAKINQALLMDFVLKRYNGSIGAFHELITEIDGKQYASSRFPMVFRSYYDDVAYAIPNIITTCGGVCTLKELGKLYLINTTKTLEWVMHCQAENGMFGPYPDASYMPLPDWCPLKTNPFEVDRYGTGIPYTFAAISLLKTLERLDAVSAGDRQKIKDYIVACQTNATGMISVHKDYYYPKIAFTSNAVMTLYYLGMLDEAKDAVTKIENRLQEVQRLRLFLAQNIFVTGFTMATHSHQWTRITL
jgi:prenyltransferase beta subunit